MRAGQQEASVPQLCLRPMQTVLPAGLLLAGLLLLLPGAALAHAILLQSQPPAGGTTAAGPTQIVLRFNSRIDGGRSRVALATPDHEQTVLKVALDAPPDILRAEAMLVPGSYVVHWQVLAVDGHITRGDVPFTVLEH